ncbi:GNAT family N-acetyltransferase [Chloroflexota bacterium]
MGYYRKLVGEKCYLSPCTSQNAEQWTVWDNDLEVAIPLGDEAYTIYSLEKMREITREVMIQQSHLFSIVDAATDTLIGRCLLFDIDAVNRKAMLGLVIGEKEYWNRGYGKEATRLLLDYGFNLLNLNNIMLGTFSFNVRALDCFRGAGFKEIGRRRQARIIAGRSYDLVLLDILAEEFKSVYVQRFME